MAEFKIIETQEEFDNRIKDRIARAESAVREQFKDYDKIKAAAADSEKKIEELTAELAKKQTTIDGHQAVVDDLNAKIKEMELSSTKVSIALEKGLPYQMAERLTGANKEEITADADAMVKLIGSTKKAPPMRHDDPAGKSDPTAAAYRSLLGNLRQGD